MVHNEGGFSLTFTADTKTAVLDKSSPAPSDDGDYKCEFQFSQGDGPSATSKITVARKLHYNKTKNFSCDSEFVSS